MTAQTPAQRVEKLRQERAALGLRRLEVYAHPDDWPAVKALAERLQRKRRKSAMKTNLERPAAQEK